ncbi:hypothetical protein GGTG_11654 [Gaeumannomyces tritici R3-111a-1]|uniref:Uncharacterized protein n=1 Tax=Gaeumannomyces tritici (strain R3-111a-1) TaxID=644352 RepID=J3PDT1_GAET3|nr:hypothetical protein GGTG_11654 [Gaeumannomyces tritici R3-111a-1]EJT70631.1 hypothetical protein GGTG_11654 [Gaeumannomyces tritici R3-111a-1]
MDSSLEPGIRIQRSVSVTSGPTQRGTSSSSHRHHLHSGGRARATSSASMSDTVFESIVGGGGGSVKRRRHRSLPHGTPLQTIADDGGGCDKDAATVTTAVAAPARRAGSVVLPSPRSSVLPGPKGHEARMRMIVKQQREVQEIRELAEFLRNRTPPPENFMSRPDDAMSSRSASPEPPKSRSQLARRWCALKSVFALRRRKAHKDEQKRRARRASADLAPTAVATTAIAHPLPRRPKTAQFKLPDSAVAGTTIAGHRHIAISIPVQHSHLGPEPKSQYPIYAPGEDRAGGGLFLSPLHAPAAAAELDAAQQDGGTPWLTALGPVSEGHESGDDAASRSPLSSPGYHTPIGMSAATITATPPARVVMVRNSTPPSDLRGGQAAPTTAASEARQHPTEQQQQRGKAAALEAPAPPGSPQSDSYFTAPNSLSSAPASPFDMGTFGPGRTGVRSTLGDRSVSIDRLLHGDGSDEEVHEDEDAAAAASDPQKRSNTNRKGEAGHHRRRSSMASRQSIADSILTDGTEPVIMTDIQTVRRISSSPSVVHQRLSAAAPRHSLPPGLAIPPLRGSEYGGGDVPVTAIRLLPSPVSSSGSDDSGQHKLRRMSRDIRNSPPLGDDGVPGTPASQRTIRPQRQAEDELYVDAPQGLDRSPLTPFPIETGFVEQAEGGSGEGGDGAAFFASSSGARVGLNLVMTVSATEATTPPGSRGSLAASGVGSSRHSSVIVTKRLPEFQLQPAPTRLARGNGESGTATPGLTQSPASPARRTKSLNLAARHLVVGGGPPSAVQQRHLLAPTWPAGDQPLPPTPSSGPTPPDSPKPSKAAAVATEAPPAEEPAAAVPLSVNHSQRRSSAPVSEAVKSTQGSARKVSAQQQQQQQESPQSARKEQGQHTEKPEQPMDRISLSRRIERRKKIAAAAAGARQAEVFAAVAATTQAQQKQAEEKQKQQAQQEDEHEHDGGANHFYHHHCHHAAPREGSLNRQRQASIPRSASLYSASSYGRHHQQEHHHHHRNPTSASAAAAATLLTPGERRVEEMERRVRLLEQTGEAWLGALVPLIESLGRTLEAQRANQQIEDYRRRRRMSSNSSVGEWRQPPPPAPDAAPYGSQRERRRQASRSERPKTSGGFESYSRGSSRSVRQPADEADGEFAVRDRAASLHHPKPPISSYFGLPPSPAEREHMDAAAVRARRRSTTSTSSKRTAVLVGDFEDEVSRRLGLEDDAQQQQQQQQQSQRPRSHHGWSRQSSQGPLPRGSSAAAALDEAKRTSPSVRSRRPQQQRPETSHSSQRPKTAYGHRRELSGASAFSAASSSRLEHHSSGGGDGGGGGSSSRTRERYDEAGIDGLHALAPLMNELTGHGVSLEFYPKEPVRFEDEYEGDISPY